MRLRPEPAKTPLGTLTPDANSQGRALETVFLGVVAEGSERHAEELGGLHLDAVGATQRFGDELTLDGLNVTFEVEAGFRERFGERGANLEAGRGSRGADGGWQAVRQDQRGAFQGDRSFDGVFQ